jgi:tetratricopeptide (TPR) repeat protein
MSVKVANNRFIVFSFAGFYQQAIKKHLDFQELGDCLVQTAEAAQDLRQAEIVKECGIALSNLPLKQYHLWGSYYQAWCEYRKGKESQSLLENVVEQSDSCRSKALLILGAIAGEKKDFASEGRYLLEALRYAKDLATIANVSRAIAILKSKEGFGELALKDLERTLPLIRYTQPRAYYDYLNSYTVELIDAGRITEAQDVSRVVLASPFINAYPEWRETGQDLALRGYKSRSLVPIIQSFPGNVVPMPRREPRVPSDTRTHSAIFGSAPVVGLKEWKEEKMVKEPNGDDDINPDKMSEQDMVMKLIQMLTTGEGDEKKIRELLKSAFKIFYGK